MVRVRFAVLLVSSLGLTAAASGCKETTSSKNIRTAGIAMTTEVTATSESKVRVKTTLQVGGDESNTYVKLKGEDRLVASADGEEKQMEAIDDGVYEANFDVGDEGTLYKVELRRSDDDTDAKSNSGKLPAPFDITSDFGKDPVSRADDLTITWDPSGQSGDMQVEFEDEPGDSCIYDEDDVDIPGDTGAFVLKGKTLDSLDDDDPETCDVTATVSRIRKGTTDRALDGESKFTLAQVRAVTFASAP
jgi:hypothetical protein